jgi:hypothetical protein
MFSLLPPDKCDRCGKPCGIASISYFNEDWCCYDCLEDEKLAPTYHVAKAAEAAAVLRGDHNYSHGLTEADKSFLAARIKSRILDDSYGIPKEERQRRELF